jgi:hypothetical protein
MLSQPKSTVLQQAAKLFQQHWQHLRGNSELNSAFEKVDRLPELCSHLPQDIGLFQWKASGDTLKIQKPPATIIEAISYPYISKISQSIW